MKLFTKKPKKERSEKEIELAEFRSFEIKILLIKWFFRLVIAGVIIYLLVFYDIPL